VTIEISLSAVAGRLSLREQVTQALRAALVTGRLRPGEVYSAPALAAQFGVSATPVREAMLDLAKEGLVQVVPNKGFRVTELDEADLDHYTELRRLIEVPTVRRLAETRPPEVFEALRPGAAAIVEAARVGDLIAYIEADRAFHLDLLALGGNPRLVTMVAELRDRSRLYGLSDLAAAGTLTASAEEHVLLLDQLAAGDASATEHLMSRHLGHVRTLWSAARPRNRAAMP
jgi:DNA-binding GntR family transcriptional regulator